MKSTLPGGNGRRMEDPLLLKHRLRDMNARIRELEDQLSAQYQERDEIEEEITSMSAAQPPIHTIPVEILVNIFTEVVAHQPSHGYNKFIDCINRINLILTCNRWREVVTNTPVLWSTIVVQVPPPTYDVLQWGWKQNHNIDQCLLRSGETDLHVTIDLTQVILGYDYSQNRVWNYLKEQDKMDHDFEADYEEALFDWSAEVAWDRCPMTEKYDSLIRELLWKLMGVDAMHMARWSHLRLALPHETEARSILEPLFSQQAPTLRHVALAGRSDGLRLSTYPPMSVHALTFVQHLHILAFSLQDLPECPNLQSMQILFGSLDNN